MYTHKSMHQIPLAGYLGTGNSSWPESGWRTGMNGKPTFAFQILLRAHALPSLNIYQIYFERKFSAW